jgi:hypothetical protein
MTVLIIGPLIGFVFWTSIVAGVLLLLFEALLVVRLRQLIGRWRSDMATAERKRAAREAEQAEQARPGAPAPPQISPESTPTRV